MVSYWTSLVNSYMYQVLKPAPQNKASAYKLLLFFKNAGIVLQT